MNDEETLNIEVKKKVDEFIQRIEKVDRYPRSHQTIESANNWMLAISVGTLLLLIGNFDKFIVSNVIPKKSLFMLAVIFLGLSTLFFAFVQMILYYRKIGMNLALDNIQNNIQKLVEKSELRIFSIRKPNVRVDYLQQHTM